MHMPVSADKKLWVLLGGASKALHLSCMSIGVGLYTTMRLLLIRRILDLTLPPLLISNHILYHAGLCRVLGFPRISHTR